MSDRDYFRCLDAAATATRVGEVERVRREVLVRWRGDPRADDLAEALYVQERRLEEREPKPQIDRSRTEARVEESRVEPTYAASPTSHRQSLRSAR